MHGICATVENLLIQSIKDGKINIKPIDWELIKFP